MVRVWPALTSLLNMLVRASFCMAVRETCLDGATTPLDDGGGDLVGLVVGLTGFAAPELVPGWASGQAPLEDGGGDLVLGLSAFAAPELGPCCAAK